MRDFCPVRPAYVRTSAPLCKPLRDVTLNLCGIPRFFGGKLDGLLLLEKKEENFEEH